MCFNSYVRRVKYYDYEYFQYSYRYVTVKCGRCAACISEKARETSEDILRELPYYNYGLDASFVTLTYARPFSREVKNGTYKCGFTYSPDTGKPILDYEHFVNFKKRLRRKIDYHKGLKIKIYSSSEYGLKTNSNPHYHLIILGLNCRIPEHVAFIKSCWNYGHVHVGSVTDKSIRYCTSYMSKSHDFKTGRISSKDKFDFSIYRLTALLELKLFDYLCEKFNRCIDFNDCLFSRELVENIYYFGASAIKDSLLLKFYNYYFIPFLKSNKLLNKSGCLRFNYKLFYEYKYGRVLEFSTKSPNFGRRYVESNFDILFQSDHVFTRREKRFICKHISFIDPIKRFRVFSLHPDFIDKYISIQEHNKVIISKNARLNFYEYLNKFNINESELVLKSGVNITYDVDRYNIYLYSNFQDILDRERLQFEQSFRDRHKEYIYKLQIKRKLLPVPEVA